MGAMRWNELKNDRCPVARGLSVVGDRWTMLVLRESFFGTRRFEQIQERLGIARPVLANRLAKLEADGLLYREAYQARPVRYEYKLTERGKSFYPVLVSLIKWAELNVPCEHGSVTTMLDRNTARAIKPILIDAESGEEITYKTVIAKRTP